MCKPESRESSFTIQHAMFTQISAAALIIFTPQMSLLFEGGANLKMPFI